jgi:hypothetical protein
MDIKEWNQRISQVERQLPKARKIVSNLIRNGVLKEIPIENLPRPWEFRGSYYRNYWELVIAEALKDTK